MGSTKPYSERAVYAVLRAAVVEKPDRSFQIGRFLARHTFTEHGNKPKITITEAELGALLTLAAFAGEIYR